MPIALEPGGRYPVVLEIDKDKPAATRPTFYFRALSGRKIKEATSYLAELKESANDDMAFVKFFDAVRVGLVGWEHMIDPETGEPIAYDPQELDALVTPHEAMELFYKMIEVGAVPAKNSASPH